MSVLTYLEYPDGRVPSPEETEQVIRFLLTTSKWIDPKFYGSAEADQPVPQMSLAKLVDFLVRFYEQEGSITLVEKRGLQLIVSPPTPTLAAGSITWEAPAKHPALTLSAHMPAVWHMMHLVRTPLAESMSKNERDAFSMRLIQCDGYEEEEYTVLGYRNGLRHAFWRMWFGAPYVAFFRKKSLDAAPAFYKQALDPDGVFVQLHKDPDEWSSSEGRAASAAFQKALGRKAFYNPESPEDILETPDFG
jgi:hypothetical protein